MKKMFFFFLYVLLFSCNKDDCDEGERWHHRAYDNAVEKNTQFEKYIVKFHSFVGDSDEEISVRVEGKTSDLISIGTLELDIESGLTIDSLKDNNHLKYLIVDGYYTGEYNVYWYSYAEEGVDCPERLHLYQAYREKIVITSFDTISADSINN